MAQEKRSSSALPFIVLLVAGLGVVAFLLVKMNILSVKVDSPNTAKLDGTLQAKPSPTPMPKPIGSGKVTVDNSFGKDVIGPKMYQTLFDPIDPALNSQQTITAKVRYTAPVTSVTATLTTDTKNTEIPFKLTSGTDTDGVWTATWTVNDTYEQQYYGNFILKSSDGTTYEGGPTFRALPAKQP